MRGLLVHLATGPPVVEAVLKYQHTGWNRIHAVYATYGCDFGQKEWGEKPAEVAAGPGCDCCAEIHANVCASGVREKGCTE